MDEKDPQELEFLFGAISPEIPKWLVRQVFLQNDKDTVASLAALMDDEFLQQYNQTKQFLVEESIQMHEDQYQIIDDNTSQWQRLYQAVNQNDRLFLQLVQEDYDQDEAGRENLLYNLAVSKCASEIHPIQKLQTLFPRTGVEDIQKVYESFSYNFEATYDRLAAFERDAKRLKNSRKSQQRIFVADPGAYPSLPSSGATKKKAPVVNRKHRPPEVKSAWIESTSTFADEMILSKLCEKYCSVDREIIYAVFCAQNADFEKTDEAVDCIFPDGNKPRAQSTPTHRTSSLEIALDIKDMDYPISCENESMSLPELRKKTFSCWNEMQSLYALSREHRYSSDTQSKSRRRQRMTELRRTLSHTHRCIARKTFEQSRTELREGNPIDVHNLTVVEVLCMAQLCFDYCKSVRISRVSFICGIGRSRKQTTIPKLHKALAELCDKRNHRYEDGDGIIKIQLRY